MADLTSLSPAVRSPAASAAGTATPVATDHLWTARGVVLFVTGLAVALSASERLRLAVAGFSIHPFLAPLAVLVIMTGIVAFGRLPRPVMIGLVGYTLIFTLLSIPTGLGISDIVKLITFDVTVWTLAVAARRRSDIVLGITGFVVAITLVGLVALLTQRAGITGINPLGDTGNKNAYSLYALPALLLAGFLVTSGGLSKRFKILMAVAAVVMTITIFSTGNRSGWVGVLVVGVMLLSRGRRLRDVVVVVGLGASAFVLLTTVGSTEAFLFRLSRPTTSVQSDEVRSDLVQAAIDLGAANPIFGVGPPRVTSQLGDALGTGYAIETHNIFAEVWAGGGVVLTAAFVGLMASLWRKPKAWRAAPMTPSARQGLGLLRMMVALFLVRGFFAADIITIPGFMFGFGYALAFVVLELREPAPARTVEAAPDDDDIAPAGLQPYAVRRRNPGGSSTNTVRHRDLFAEARDRRHEASHH